MSRPRLSLRRWLGVAALLLLLALLLELNRFFPGTWPGGGSHGAPRPGADAAGAAAPDPARVAPPGGLPADGLPHAGVRVSLRLASGRPATDLRVAAEGDPAGEVSADPAGTLGLRPPLGEGFGVRAAGGTLHHRAGAAAREWVVYLPSHPLPGEAEPGEVRLVVRQAEDGAPLEGAEVRRRDAPGALRTDAGGEAPLPHLPVRAEVEIRAPGRRSERHWLSGLEPGRVEVRLERVQAVELPGADWESPRLVDPLADGPPLPLARDPQRGLWRAEVEAGRAARLLVVGQRRRGAGLEGVAQPLVAALAGAAPPPGRPVRLRVLGVRDHAPLAGVRVRARARPPLGGSAAETPFEVLSEATSNAAGEVDLWVPAGAPFTLSSEHPLHAPRARAYLAEDATDRIDWALEPALHAPIEVVDERGAPLAGAQVLARQDAAVGGARARGTCDAAGRIEVGPLAPGEAEVFARAEGHAWARAAIRVGPAMGSVRLVLAPGDRLRLKVEDHVGRPLAGVRVLLHPEPPGPPWVEPPDAPPLETDADGGLVVDFLPRVAFRAELLREGYRPERLHGLWPGPALYFATLLR